MMHKTPFRSEFLNALIFASLFRILGSGFGLGLGHPGSKL